MKTRAVLTLVKSLVKVTARRALRGPLLPGWPARFEWYNEFLTAQWRQARRYPLAQQRQYHDALVAEAPALRLVQREAAACEGLRADWVTPHNAQPGRVMLYLHGGGFTMYARPYRGLIAHLACAARARTLALDYRLAPEHPFPAAVEDCIAAYRWLLESGLPGEGIVVAGDSAGGNLVLALLQRLRGLREALPALGVLFSPYIDLENGGDSMKRNAPYDWLRLEELVEWSAGYLDGSNPRQPLLSPLHADFRGLPPLYVQAGTAEILYDGICALVENARRQGANITFDEWQHMVHVFQFYGDSLAHSREALEKFGRMIDLHLAPVTRVAREALPAG